MGGRTTVKIVLIEEEKQDLRVKRSRVLMKRYPGKKHRDIILSDENIFTVEKSYNIHNDKVYAHNSEEASNRIPRI